jgi:penicillin-binding protein 1A
MNHRENLMIRFRAVFKSSLRIIGGSILGLALLGLGLGTWVYRQFESDLPANLGVITDYQPIRASQIWSADGELIGEFFVEKRVLLPIDQVPDLVRKAFVAAEDGRFYRHGGVDYLGITRAAWANFRAGGVVQGGSSITQQVAKILIVGQERSLARKVREALLAFRIEKRLSKDQILGIYLNHVYLGHGAYGLAAAATAYFGKNVSDLTVAEAAMLAALPKAPGSVTPVRDFERARVRQQYVLDQMRELGFISAAQADNARNESLVLVSRTRAMTNVAAPYFVEAVRKHVAERHGDEELLRRGFRITTTLDMRRQRAAESALRRGLEDLQRRLGFAGPMGHLDSEQRRRMAAGQPRPVGPEGFVLDEEQSPYLMAIPDPPGVTVDATSPGARLPDAAAKHATGEAWAQRRRALKSREAPLYKTDPDTIYAAVVTGLGKKVMVASGGLLVPLEPASENQALAWSGTQGEHLSVGDVLPVYLRTQKGSGPSPREDFLAHLASAPTIQGALIAVDPSNGYLVSMVGGYDYQKSQFNRATQAHRQIGSAIKPFVYAAAIDHGMTPLTIKWDAPVKFKTASGMWSPHNYKPDYLGPVTLRTALAKSINTVSAQLLAQVGLDPVIELMRRLGITSKLPHSLSLALGTPDLTLQEVAYGLAAFPAGGKLVTPLYIIKITDADGRVLEDHSAPAPREAGLSPETAYVVTDLMKGVVEVGTGKKARELGRPAAGKTGTSTNYRDAWFFGFVPELLCGVWVGRDDFKPIGHDATGGQVALPIWLSYMQEALQSASVRDFDPPPGVIFVRADPEKGVPATPEKPGSRLIPLKRGTLPPAFRAGSSGRFSDERF